MAGEGGKRAIFLDRDGTLLVEMGYLNHFSQVKPYRFTLEALRKAKEHGFTLICVTNQSGIARGYLTERDLKEIHRRMQRMLCDDGAELDGIYYCPHHPEGTVTVYTKRCACRKPSPVLGQRAARRFGIDLTRSFMVGDKETDLLFGSSLGVTPCLVRTGYGAFEERQITGRRSGAVPVFDNVLDAVDWITGDA
jgi:D-glycero-D-manno-heptose 1,7-bisphosphate phosphatase